MCRAVCDDETLEWLVEPTLADLQHEVAAAGLNRPRRWMAYVRGYAGLCRAFVSVLAATIGAEQWRDGHSRIRVILRNLNRSATACAVAYTVLQLRFVVDASARLGWPLAVENALAVFPWALLLAIFFSAVAAVVYYPILLASKRLSKNRLLPSLLGAVLFPIPWELYAAVRHDPHLHLWHMMWVRPVTPIILLMVPFVIGGAVLGWLLANRPQRPVAHGPVSNAISA